MADSETDKTDWAVKLLVYLKKWHRDRDSIARCGMCGEYCCSECIDGHLAKAHAI
jgi:hypothetical protein